MKKLIPIISIILAVTAIFTLACSGGSSNDTTTTIGTKVNVEGGSYTSVNSAELYQMLQNKDFTLVNTDPMPNLVIPDTDLFIPHNELLEDLSSVSQNKTEKIVIYCMIGSNSSLVAVEFEKMGFSDIYNLAGGIVGWQQQGYPVVTP
jgi:rhodanese-related sulfurtransferase